MTTPPTLRLMNTGTDAVTKLAQVAPGQFEALAIDAADVPRFGIVRMMRQGDGSYIPVLKSYGELRRCGAQLLKDIGLETISIRTFYRLVGAEFVKSTRPAPGVILIDLASVVEHIEAARDPEFWTPERLRRFKNASPELR